MYSYIWGCLCKFLFCFICGICSLLSITLKVFKYKTLLWIRIGGLGIFTWQGNAGGLKLIETKIGRV